MKIKHLFLTIILLFNLDSIMAQTQIYSAHDFHFTKEDGSKLELSQYKDKILLVVNVASKCWFADQYQELQKLYDEYHEYGLEIIAVPSNDFGKQELNEYCEIKNLATARKITFEIVQKEIIVGKDAHPFFKWITDNNSMFASPKWNFYKYIINYNGELSDWFSSITKPSSKRMTNAIRSLLPL